jgi:bacillopeptidase F
MVALTWPYGAEPDLAGYRVYRSTTSGSGYQPVGPFLDRPIFVDTAAPRGTAVYYVIRAFDTSVNTSAQSAEVAATAG